MKLYLVEIGGGHLKYKYLSNDLNLYILNKLLEKEDEHCPLLNHNDHRLIKDCGGTIVLNGRVTDGLNRCRVWIINVEHDERCVTASYERQFGEMVSGIILTVKRDIKLESINE